MVRGSIRNFGEMYDASITGISHYLWDMSSSFETVQTIHVSGCLYLKDATRDRMDKIYKEIKRCTIDIYEESDEELVDPSKPDFPGPHLKFHTCEAFIKFYEDLKRLDGGAPIEVTRPQYLPVPLQPDSHFYASIALAERRGASSTASTGLPTTEQFQGSMQQFLQQSASRASGSGSRSRSVSTGANPLHAAQAQGPGAISGGSTNDFNMIEQILGDDSEMGDTL